MSEVNLEQAQAPGSCSQGTMLGKRSEFRHGHGNTHKRRTISIEDRKSVSTCNYCGKRGHWWKDNPKCAAGMKKRIADTPHTKNKDETRFRDAANTPSDNGQDKMEVTSDTDDDNPKEGQPRKETKSFFRR